MEEDRPWWILVGGRHRLGRALSELFSEQERLVITSSRPWQEEQAWLECMSKTSQVRIFQWDADDPGLVPQMMADLERLRDGGVRLGNAIIIAGTFPKQPIGTWNQENLISTINRNLGFPMLAAQALASNMEKGGCLQFVLDTAIHRPFAQRMPYTAAKAGLAAIIPALAKELAPGLRVVGHAIGTLLPNDEDDISRLKDGSLLKRIGEPKDLARAIRYAAESPYLTGEILTLDGGTRWR